MAFDFFEGFDLNHDTSQKKYSTVAAYYYRNRLKRAIDGHQTHPVEKEQPSWEEGRQVMKLNRAVTY